jgi:16S rRNA (guanine(966)-N(2))-methyltransferase RsmD
VPDGGRVIAGSAAGLRLLAPGPATRPLGDRVKQTLFAILEPELPGAVVLDLFAGSGAAGIEALSRGAAHAVFVDRDAAALRAIRANLERTGLASHAVVRAGDVLAFLRSDAPHLGPFDLVVVDPPYAETALLLGALDALGLPPSGTPTLASGARVVVKHHWRAALPESVGLLRSERSRRFGETALTFYRALGEGSPP